MAEISLKLLKEASIVRELNDTDEEFAAKVIWLHTELSQIDILGWAEHTSDWDLGLVVTLNTGVQINSLIGYADFEFGYLNEDKTEFTHEDVTNIILGSSDSNPNAIRIEEDADLIEDGASKDIILLTDIARMEIIEA